MASSRRGAAIVLTLAFLVGCSSSLCGNDVLTETISPDGSYVATLFERNCGATTPYIRIVSLREAGQDFDPERHADWVFTIHHGRPNVAVSWDDARKLRVQAEGTGYTPTRRDAWKDVTIGFD